MIKGSTHTHRHPLWAVLLLGYFPDPDRKQEITAVDMDVVEEWWDRVNIMAQQEDIPSIGHYTIRESMGGQLGISTNRS